MFEVAEQNVLEKHSSILNRKTDNLMGYDAMKYHKYVVSSKQKCHLCYFSILYVTTQNGRKHLQFSTKQAKYLALIQFPFYLI